MIIKIEFVTNLVISLISGNLNYVYSKAFLQKLGFECDFEVEGDDGYKGMIGKCTICKIDFHLE